MVEISKEKYNISIYALFDPRFPDTIRYIGKTSKSIETRLKEHIYDSNRKKRTYKRNWISSLMSEGITPCVKLLANTTETGWQEQERRQIAIHLEAGHPLTNIAPGGEGVVIHTPESIQKMREAALCRPYKPLSEETKLKLSIVNKGKIISEEHRQKISKAKKGIPCSEQNRKALSAACMGKIPTREAIAKREETKRRKREAGVRMKAVTEDTKKKMRAAQLGKKQSSEVVAKRMASSKITREAKKAALLVRLQEEALIQASLEEGFSIWL